MEKSKGLKKNKKKKKIYEPSISEFIRNTKNLLIFEPIRKLPIKGYRKYKEYHYGVSKDIRLTVFKKKGYPTYFYFHNMSTGVRFYTNKRTIFNYCKNITKKNLN